MDYLLFNDTSYTANPGCQGTVTSLCDALAERSWVRSGSWPVGLVPNHTMFMPNKWVRLWRRLRKDDRTLSAKTAAGLRDNWNNYIDWLQRYYSSYFERAPQVVVNGEGTLHHNQVSALALCAMMVAAHRCGCRVSLVNCTIQEMDPWVLEQTLAACSFVSVREQQSLSHLKDEGYKVTQAADALFLHKPKLDSPTDDGAVIYTPGVHAITMSSTQFKQQLAVAMGMAKRADLLVVEREDTRFVPAAVDAGLGFHFLRSLPWTKVSDLLNSYGTIVSGRYHIAIYAWLAGRDVHLLPTNSWKIAGLLELAGIDQQPADASGLEGPYQFDEETLARLRGFALKNLDFTQV